MNAQCDHFFSLSLELRIIRARHIYLTKSSGGELFIRCYLPAGSNKRVKLDTKQIPSKSDHLTWDQTFSLDCLGTQDYIKRLEKGTLVFELRQRSCARRMIMNGSKLLARAEMTWKGVVDSPNMEIEKWVVMIPKKGCVHDGVKPPAVQIAMKVEYPKAIVGGKAVSERWDECGCKSCVDYEFFAIEAVLEAF